MTANWTSNNASITTETLISARVGHIELQPYDLATRWANDNMVIFLAAYNIMPNYEAFIFLDT